MEPTLISVLSVRSLQKLELVGDHRQLPAFVQVLLEYCWLNYPKHCTLLPSVRKCLQELSFLVYFKPGKHVITCIQGIPSHQ